MLSRCENMQWSERELWAQRFGFHFLLMVVNKGVEYSLFRVGISWKQGLAFPSLFCLAFCPALSAILGLSTLIQFLVTLFWSAARIGL